MTWRQLTTVWVAMLLLLSLSVTATLLPALGAWRQIVSLGIASIKAALILWCFMELRQASGLVRLFALCPLIFIAILQTLLAIDYLSRGWLGD
jgi:cytochrome c oxidase subunit 4